MKPHTLSHPRTFFLIIAGTAFLVGVWRFLLLDGLIPLDGNMITIAYPNWAAARTFLQKGILPLWNPWRDMGEPFLADPQTMMGSPLFWLFMGISGFHEFLRLWYVLHTLLAAGFMGALGWRWYQNAPAAAAAALIGGFNGFFLSHLSPNVFASAAWLPAALYFSDRRSWIGLGSVLGLQWLAGFPDFSILTVLAACAPRFAEGRSGAVFLLRSGFLALGLSAVQLVPFVEFFSHSTRPLWVDSASAIQFSIPPKQLLKELFAPLWSYYRPDLKDDPAVTAFYIGLPALAMACFGMWKGTSREKKWAGVTAACCLVSLGSYLPGFRQLRILHFFCYPAHWLLIASAGVALLTAAGIAKLSQRTALWVVGLIALDLLLFAQVPRIAWFQPEFLTQRPPLAERLRQRPYPVRIYHTDPFQYAWFNQPLRTQDDFSRFQTFLPPSYGMAFGVADVRSHQVLCLKQAKAFHQRLAKEGPRSPLLQLAGIGTVVTVDRDFTSLDTGGRIFDLRDPKPPLFLAPEKAGNHVTTLSLQPGSAESSVVLTQPARLIFNQIAYPGWRFMVDGEKRPYELFEETFLSIVLPAGEHQVKAVYQPLSVWIGALVTLMSWICLGVFFAYRR